MRDTNEIMSIILLAIGIDLAMPLLGVWVKILPTLRKSIFFWIALVILIAISAYVIVMKDKRNEDR